MRIAVYVVALLLALGLLAGCGGSSSGPGTPAGLSLSPTNQSVRAGQTLQFLAFLSGQAAPVTWSVEGGASNGTITTGGLYTAPATPGTYRVRVALQANPAVTATANVIVQAPIAVAISGTIPAMIPRSSFDFDAVVTNATNPEVTWTVLGGAVPIDPTGRFTAPVVGSYTIIARSVEDPSKTASATVQVVADLDVSMVIEGRGTVVFDLRPDEAPNTSANFVSLVNAGFYSGIVLHRYEVDFVIQGGDPLTKTLPLTDSRIGTGGPGYTIPFEANPLNHEKYALAMARKTDPDSAGSQFYVALDVLTSLDRAYVVFGKVRSGTDVVDALRRGDVIASAVTQAPPAP